MNGCLHCGAELPIDASWNRLYCNEVCGREHRRPVKVDNDRTCACGVSLAGRRPNVLHCSARCRDRARRARERDERPPRPPRRPRRDSERPSARKYRSGQRWGALELIAYAGRSEHGDTLADFKCDCGSRKTMRLGNVTSGVSQSCGDARHRHVGEGVTINRRHQQLSETYGPASSRRCVFCGAPAAVYAYLHGGEGERAQLTGKDRGQVFTVGDDRDYGPACRGCHSAFDAGHRRGTAHGAISLAHVALSAIIDTGHEPPEGLT